MVTRTAKYLKRGSHDFYAVATFELVYDLVGDQISPGMFLVPVATFNMVSITPIDPNCAVIQSTKNCIRKIGFFFELVIF